MDIVIKSFNRPYYLDRCLRSIRQHVVGKYNLVVLDDGTSQLYLDRIQEIFPAVQILKSEDYEEKSQAIEAHIKRVKNYNNTSIPVRLWRDSIARCSDVFLLLEEDTWFTQTVYLEQMISLIKEENLLIVKLCWHGNGQIIKGKKIKISDHVEEIIPSLPVASAYIMKPFFNNVLKIRSVLFKTGIVSMKDIAPYYALYTVTSAFFQKNYWLSLWEDAASRVNEMHQILKALQWKSQFKQSRYGKTYHELIDSSFITSCINYYKIVDFDMIRLNHHLNQAWLNGNLNVMNNFPKDFSIPYLRQLLTAANEPDCTPNDWEKWININKTLYRSTGCTVE